MCFIEQILFKFLYPKQFFFLLGQLRKVLISCIPVYGWLNPSYNVKPKIVDFSGFF